MSSNRSVFRNTKLLKDLPEGLIVHSVKSGETLGYAGLARRVEDCAKAIEECLDVSQTRVVIGISNPIEVLITLFATWVSGHCAVLVNARLAEDEKNRVISKVKPDLWIDDTGIQIVSSGPPAAQQWSNAALILMTSGTTGEPKGVTHSLETLEARLRLNVEEIGTETLAHTLCPLPLFFGHGLIGNCLTPLLAGQTVHILDAPDLRDYSEFGKTIDSLNITFLSSVPSIWRMVLRLSPRPSLSPTRVHIGSAPLSNELWSEIEEWCGSKNVFNTYGMTETANWIAGGKRPKSGAEGYVGRPWGGSLQVRRNDQLYSHGRGEILVTSPSMMLGLWGEKEGTALKDGRLSTGDIGELSEDGTLRLVGRIKNEINRGGIKVLAEEVDMLLERHPNVAEACAFGIPDDITGELVAGVIKLQKGYEPTPQSIIAWCRKNARSEAVPSRIAVVEEIPKTDRGKPDRQTIQEEMIRKWS